MVASVQVMILDEQEKVVEKGEGIKAKGTSGNMCPPQRAG